MRILLTGSTGYIGKRLMNALLIEGHQLICCVRDKSRLEVPENYENQVQILEYDFSNEVDVSHIDYQIDAAYYLIHSLSSTTKHLKHNEENIAVNFRKLAEKLACKQVIYLGGIANDNQLSDHLQSRKGVEASLRSSKYATTILRAAIIVGSGSASFEIIRDLVEKLPIMITPKWVNTRCQPIAIKNVIDYLIGVLGNQNTFDQTFDIGGPDTLSYKQMMKGFSEVRKLKRFIWSIPVMTPRLSSYWLYFITSTNYKLAVNLVNSMKVEVVCKENNIREIIPIELLEYKEAVKRAFDKIQQNLVVSSWTDALSSSNSQEEWGRNIQVPQHGCYKDHRQFKVKSDKQKLIAKVWKIGGNNGWYYADWLWQFRGFLDRLVGGVGLRRGRTNENEIYAGEALDCWRVLYANKEQGRLLLYAEMNLPGEAWLEFKTAKINDHLVLLQQATFRPKGLFGRLYWWVVSPFHHFIFNGMGNKLTN